MGRDEKRWVGIHLKFNERLHKELLEFREKYNLMHGTKVSKTYLIEVAVQEFLDKYSDDIENIKID